MPNSHLQETDTPIYPIHTRILEDFLGVHDYVPSIELNCTVFKKGTLFVEVPHLKKLDKFQVTTLLKKAEMLLSDFEQYYQHLQTMDKFDSLVDLSGGTLKD